ncbi:hypothetical protein GCM10010299_10090 [Streptomyces tanashiensis]|nr:hypothetical protein GCM10010299_10090 [Streptomyces tanashiensis]
MNPSHAPTVIPRGREGTGAVAGLPHWDRCAVMGVVNVTPDSFSDGGRWSDPAAAVKHGLELVAGGAPARPQGGPGVHTYDREERPGSPG